MMVQVLVTMMVQVLVTMMVEVIRPSETSVLTRATRRNIQEDVILHSLRRKKLKSYTALSGWDV
jgi:hypothetical protein